MELKLILLVPANILQNDNVALNNTLKNDKVSLIIQGLTASSAFFLT